MIIVLPAFCSLGIVCCIAHFNNINTDEQGTEAGKQKKLK